MVFLYLWAAINFDTPHFNNDMPAFMVMKSHDVVLAAVIILVGIIITKQPI